MSQPTQHNLILMAGLPGSGKNALALALGAELGWPVIDKDVILAAMLVNVSEAQAQPASYEVMLALARNLIVNQRHSVILDSPATWQQTTDAAKNISLEGKSTFHVILCLADRETRNERVRTRAAMRSQPTLGISTTQGTGVERFRHLPMDTIQINTELPLDVCVDEAMAQLRRANPKLER